jgi:hypothetical protein
MIVSKEETIENVEQQTMPKNPSPTNSRNKILTSGAK